MRLRALIPAVLVALVPISSAAAQDGIGIDQIREWIAAHHPQVYQDTSANTVVIVVDSSGKYLRSIAARFEPSEVAAMDFRFARLEELIAARAGSRQVDTLLSYACSGARKEPPNRAPLCILDGARVGSFDSVQSLAMHKLETLSGAAATARYGADASNGVVIGSTVPALLERYKGLGITAANMGWLQANRVRSGTVGPGRLDVLLVFLKSPNG